MIRHTTQILNYISLSMTALVDALSDQSIPSVHHPSPASIAPWIINTQHPGTIYQRPRYHTLMAAATLEPTFTLGTKKANPDLHSPRPLVGKASRTQHSTKKHPPHEPDPQPRAAHVPGHRQVRSTRSAPNLQISGNYRAPGRRGSGFWAPFRSDDCRTVVAPNAMLQRWLAVRYWTRVVLSELTLLWGVQN